MRTGHARRRIYMPGEAAAAGLGLAADVDFLCFFGLAVPGDAADAGLAPAAGLAAAVAEPAPAFAFAFFLQR